jgi:hypothetical protein
VLAFAPVWYESTPYNSSHMLYNFHETNLCYINNEAQVISNIEHSGYIDMPQSKLGEDSFKVDKVYANTKMLIRKVEDVYRGLNLPTLKRDRLYYHFLKSLRSYLTQGFKRQFPDFEMISNDEKVENFRDWVTKYANILFGRESNSQFNQSMYGGEWSGVEFVFGCFISRNTMKQMLTSSREKAYFY